MLTAKYSGASFRQAATGRCSHVFRGGSRRRDVRAYICYIAFMAQSPPVVLTVAGFDPSSGAGVTADVKTIAAHGCYGVGCITALTVQSTEGVRRVEAVSPELIADTLNELQSD